MPVLLNPRHELFAQELAKGKTATEAYMLAGYKADDGNASKMAGRPEVQARVQEITGIAAEKAGVTVGRVLEELSALAFSNMLDFMRVGEDGRPYTDFSNLTREQAAAIGEIIVETTPALNRDGTEVRPEVKKIRFKLCDKRASLVDLGRHLGMFKERVEHSGPDGKPIEVKEVSNRDRAKAILAVVAKTKAEKAA